MSVEDERRILAKDRKKEYCGGCGRYLWLELGTDLCDFCKDDQTISDIRASNARIDRLEKRRRAMTKRDLREAEW